MEFYGKNSEIEALKRYYPDLIEWAEKNGFRIFVVHKGVMDIPKEKVIFVFGKVFNIIKSTTSKPMFSDIVETELIGYERDIYYIGYPLYRIYDESGNTIAEIIYDLTYGIAINFADIMHERRRIPNFEKVLELLDKNLEETDRRLLTRILNPFKEENTLVKEVRVVEYVPDMEKVEKLVKDLIRIKHSKLVAENEELKEKLKEKIPSLKKMKTFEKIFKAGFSIEKITKKYIYFTFPYIEAKYVKYKGKLYKLPPDKRLYITKLTVKVNKNLSKIINAKAEDSFHPNVDSYKGEVCLGTLEDKPAEKLPEVIKMLTTINLDSAFSQESTYLLTEMIETGKLETAEDGVWEV